MHINMCIKTVMRGRTEGLNLSILALLEKFTSICAEDDVSSPRMKAVTQALPVLFYGQLALLMSAFRAFCTAQKRVCVSQGVLCILDGW